MNKKIKICVNELNRSLKNHPINLCHIVNYLPYCDGNWNKKSISIRAISTDEQQQTDLVQSHKLDQIYDLYTFL